MTCQPREPEVRHVWVRGHSDYAPVSPGLVINWQYTQVHNGTAPSWTALVLVAPFPEAILVEHVSADRLVACATPPPPMDDDTPRRRHVWVDTGGGHKHPGIVIAWRYREDGWEAYVAVARDASVLAKWEQARASILWSMTVGSCRRVVGPAAQMYRTPT